MKKLSDYALYLVSRREYSVAMLRDKLSAKFPAQIDHIENLINQYIDCGYLDDQRFATAFVRDQVRKKNGPIKILSKSYEKGVESQYIKIALAEEYERDLQIKILRELIVKRGCPQNETEKQKLITYLQGKGFAWPTIEAVL